MNDATRQKLYMYLKSKLVDFGCPPSSLDNIACKMLLKIEVILEEEE